MENRIEVPGIKQWVSQAQENMVVTAKGTGDRVILVVMERLYFDCINVNIWL